MSVELLDVAEARINGSVDSSNEDSSPDAMRHLPPVDTGLTAWKFLFGCFMIEAVLWGMTDRAKLLSISILGRDALTDRRRVSVDLWRLPGLLLEAARV
jgi:hypothetical protein